MSHALLICLNTHALWDAGNPVGCLMWRQLFVKSFSSGLLIVRNGCTNTSWQKLITLKCNPSASGDMTSWWSQIRFYFEKKFLMTKLAPLAELCNSVFDLQWYNFFIQSSISYVFCRWDRADSIMSMNTFLIKNDEKAMKLMDNFGLLASSSLYSFWQVMDRIQSSFFVLLAARSLTLTVLIREMDAWKKITCTGGKKANF